MKTLTQDDLNEISWAVIRDGEYSDVMRFSFWEAKEGMKAVQAIYDKHGLSAADARQIHWNAAWKSHVERREKIGLPV